MEGLAMARSDMLQNSWRSWTSRHPLNRRSKNFWQRRILTRKRKQSLRKQSQRSRNWSSCKGHWSLWPMARILLLDCNTESADAQRWLQRIGYAHRASPSTAKAGKRAPSVEQQSHRRRWPELFEI